ncbi:MAG TPA: toprim domain-containing protein [Stellaceae bacterium]|nr:toprim domain-containing protein [Stellaceae bacterium]
MMARAEIVARALRLRRVRDGEWHGQCPSCGYKSGFCVTERDNRTLLYCAAGGCTQADLWAALTKAGLAASRESGEPYKARQPLSRAARKRPSGEHLALSALSLLDKGRPPEEAISPLPPRQQQKQVARAEKVAAAQQAALAIWRRSRPIAGTVAETYLRHRGYSGPLPLSLRFATGKHPADSQFHPMLVAAVVIAGRMEHATAIHRTFLRADGRGKADLDPARMSLGSIEGASIPLAPTGQILIIGEGIETTLSVAQAMGLPGWAAVSSGNMPKLLLPGCVREILIAADRDLAGLSNAYAAARRWSAYGRKVRIIMPPEGRGDFNDLAIP